MFDQFTLGIEEEFQIVDPETRELRSHVVEFLEEGRMLLGEQIKPEMIQSQIEVGTGVCKNIQEARADISNLRGIIAGLAEKNGLKIVAASTHPISRWQDQKVFEDERYELLVEELQNVARSLLIFGLHVHVGVADPERRIHIMNAARYFLPHVLALSTSSPFWMGQNTGLKSYRTEVFKKFPRTDRSEEHTSELQSRLHLVCRLLLEKKKINKLNNHRLLLKSRRRSREVRQGYIGHARVDYRARTLVGTGHGLVCDILARSPQSHKEP